MLPDKILYPTKKNQTIYCNCKRQFLSKRNTFNLNCATNYYLTHVEEMWDQWDNFNIFASFGKLADTFKVR